MVVALISKTVTKLFGSRNERLIRTYTRRIDAINALGPANEIEQPFAGDEAFAARALAWQQERGVSPEHAVLRQVLAEIEEPIEEVSRLLRAETSASLNEGASGAWLSELGRRLLGS